MGSLWRRISRPRPSRPCTWASTETAPTWEALYTLIPIFSTVAAVSGREIPPIVDEVVIEIGGAVQVAEYAFPGTEELAEKALAALGNRMAVLLRNHGLITVGRNPEEALENSILVERLAEIFMYTTLTGGVKPLPREIVELEEELYLMKRSVENAGGDSNGNDS